MFKLGIKRVLIILLYITCALRELLSAAVILIYVVIQNIDLQLTHQVTRSITAAFSLADSGLIVTVILTNFHLATSMQTIRNLITSEQEQKWNSIARVGGLIFCITLAICQYLHESDIAKALAGLLYISLFATFILMICFLRHQLEAINSLAL